MSVNSRTSALIQRVKPSLSCGLIEIDAIGSSAAVVDLVEAQPDTNSPKAIPDVPTTEAPYDGLVAFGIMLLDAAGDGP